MKAIAAYIKTHIKSFLLFALFAFLFAMVFSLYSLHVEPIVYAVLLCACAWLIVAAFDFYRFRKRHQALCELQNRITISLADLPVPKKAIEKDYHALIETLFWDKARLVSLADSAQREMTDYYTLWAHQIKTPIAAMRLLLQSDTNKRNAELLMELFKIGQYVEMVLQYLRLDSASSDFVFKKHSLDDIVKQAVRKYAKLFILKKISLEYSELNCEVLTDEKWLLFAIEQVLSNALKYTNKGRIAIYGYGDTKTLVIEDTGIGIAKEDLSRVFEKGFTGHNGRTDKKSTGIGLYLSKRVLTKLSHTIAIESEVGRFTRVTINLDTADAITD